MKNKKIIPLVLATSLVLTACSNSEEDATTEESTSVSSTINVTRESVNTNTETTSANSDFNVGMSKDGGSNTTIDPSKSNIVSEDVKEVMNVVESHNDYLTETVDESIMNESLIKDFIDRHNEKVLGGSDPVAEQNKEDTVKVAEEIGLGNYYNINNMGDSLYNLVVYYLFLKNYAESPNTSIKVDPTKVTIEQDEALVPEDAVEIVYNDNDKEKKIDMGSSAGDLKLLKKNDQWYFDNTQVEELVALLGNIPLLTEEEIQEISYK